VSEFSMTTFFHYGAPELKRNYQKRFLRGFVIAASLHFIGIGIYWSSRYLTAEEPTTRSIRIMKYSEIQEVVPLIEESPPHFKVEKIAEIKSDQLEDVDGMVNVEAVKDGPGKRELLGDKKDDIPLQLPKTEFNNYLASNSPLGAMADTEFNLRDYRTELDGGINLRRGEFSGANEGGLNIGKNERHARGAVSADARIDLGVGRPNLAASEAPTKKKPPEPTLGVSGEPERIITYASSTIGTEDYKLWNKINSELDRLSKGRYGSVPKEIRRVRGGFLLQLVFADNTRQEIHWENSGNVWIKIIGKSNRTSVLELRRALDGLLKITLGS